MLGDINMKLDLGVGICSADSFAMIKLQPQTVSYSINASFMTILWYPQASWIA